MVADWAGRDPSAVVDGLVHTPSSGMSILVVVPESVPRPKRSVGFTSDLNLFGAVYTLTENSASPTNMLPKEKIP